MLPRVAIRLAKGALVLVALVLLAEGAGRLLLRVVAPEKYSLLQRVYTARDAWTKMVQGHPELGYTLRPDLDVSFPSEGRTIPIRTTTYGLADIGFRDLGMSPPFDVIAVGGSLTLCDDVPVEGCWLWQLGRATGQSIATLGVNGYSTTAAVRMLDVYGRRFQPRIVLAEVFPNDFKDDIVFAEWERSGSDDYWTWAAEIRGRGSWARWFGSYSMLYRAFDGMSRSWGRHIFRYQDENLDYVFRFDSWWLRVARDSEGDPGWPLVRQNLENYRRIAAEMGSELMIVVTPSKEQIHWDVARQFAPRPETLNPNAPTETIRNFCRDNGIRVCDLSEPLREEARQGIQLYQTISGHWNDAGGQAAARAVEKCMSDAGLLIARRDSAE